MPDYRKIKHRLGVAHESLPEPEVRWLWPDRLFPGNTLPIVQVGLEKYFAYERDSGCAEARSACSGVTLILHDSEALLTCQYLHSINLAACE